MERGVAKGSGDEGIFKKDHRLLWGERNDMIQCDPLYKRTDEKRVC